MTTSLKTRVQKFIYFLSISFDRFYFLLVHLKISISCLKMKLSSASSQLALILLAEAVTLREEVPAPEQRYVKLF